MKKTMADNIQQFGLNPGDPGYKDYMKGLGLNDSDAEEIGDINDQDEIQVLTGAESQTNTRKEKLTEARKELLDIKSELEGMQETLQNREGEDVVSTEDISDDEDIDPSNIKERVNEAADTNEEITTGAGATYSKIENYKDMMELAREQAEKRYDEIEKMREKRDTKLAEFKKWTEERPSAEQLLRDERGKYDIPENFEKIQSVQSEMEPIRNKIADVEEEQRQMSIAAEEQGMSATYIRGEKSRIQRQYDSRISALSAKLSAKAATVEALQGNIQTAESLANNTVAAMQYDTKQNRQDIETFIDYYSGYISELSSDHRNYFNTLNDYWQKKEKWERQDLQNKMSLVVGAAEHGVNLGLTDEQIKGKSYMEVARLYQTEVGAALKEDGEVSFESYSKSVRTMAQQYIDGKIGDEKVMALNSEMRTKVYSAIALLREDENTGKKTTSEVINSLINPSTAQSSTFTVEQINGIKNSANALNREGMNKGGQIYKTWNTAANNLINTQLTEDASDEKIRAVISSYSAIREKLDKPSDRTLEAELKNAMMTAGLDPDKIDLVSETLEEPKLPAGDFGTMETKEVTPSEYRSIRNTTGFRMSPDLSEEELKMKELHNEKIKISIPRDRSLQDVGLPKEFSQLDVRDYQADWMGEVWGESGMTPEEAEEFWGGEPPSVEELTE